MHICHPSNSRKQKEELWSRLAWVESKTLSPKLTRAEKAGGLAQTGSKAPAQQV
jgi:hypothetical protein